MARMKPHQMRSKHDRKTSTNDGVVSRIVNSKKPSLTLRRSNRTGGFMSYQGDDRPLVFVRKRSTAPVSLPKLHFLEKDPDE